MSAMSSRGRGKIRAPRRTGLTKDEVDFDATWAVLNKALDDIHHKNASQLSFEELFRSAYKLVLKKKGDQLYDKVVEVEQTWLRNGVRRTITDAVASSTLPGNEPQESSTIERRVAGERFMQALKEAYQDHQLSMSMISDVLMYMDRTFAQTNTRPSIYIMAMALFRMDVLKSQHDVEAAFDILSLLETIILDMIKMERKGEVVDRSLIRACCAMLEGLYETITEEETTRLYLTSFEPKFLEASRIFYREEGRVLLQEGDASTFCSHAGRRLKEESDRCRQTISSVTRSKIIEVVEQELISAHIKDVINLEGTGVRHMLDNDRVQDLGNVFDLVARVDPRKLALKECVQKKVVELGSEINKVTNAAALEKPIKPAISKVEKSEGEKSAPEKAINQQTTAAIVWVEEVLKLKNKFDGLWERAFRKDQVLEKALEISFQDFINANERSAEHISLFFDEHLKKGGKSKTENEIDMILDDGITLLQYLGNKDLFETYYKKHMAKRLLMKKSISRDVERQLLSKMKVKLGNQFTQKMEGLIKDIELSDNLNGQYREYVRKLGDKDPKRVDVEASILTTTVWPINSLFRADEEEANRKLCIYPESVEQARQKFERFYLDKHTGRKLSWLPNMGTADLRATFQGSSGKIRKYEVNVSTYGMVILMLFNELAPGESYTFEEIAAETNIPEMDLIRNLQSLCLSQKWRMLKKEPMSKDVKPTDKFFFNEEYTSQFLKIKVSVVSQSSNRIENAEERRATQRRADEERGHAIEAAIVRIMKARKTLTHQQLMSETLTQLSHRFQPDVNMIKKKIEALIDREYLERGSDANTYNYLA